MYNNCYTLLSMLVLWMCSSVLVLEGIELMFFMVAGTVLCFGFSIRIKLLTRWCFSSCRAVLTQSWGIFSFRTVLTVRSQGCTRRWEGTQTEQLAQTGQKVHSMLYGIMPSNKSGRFGQGRDVVAGGLARHPSAGGEQLHRASFYFFASISFFPFFFLTHLPFSILFITSLWGEWANGCVVLYCLLG